MAIAAAGSAGCAAGHAQVRGRARPVPVGRCRPRQDLADRPVPRRARACASRRDHFHRFMQDVHARLRATARPRPARARRRAASRPTPLLCLDEFFVSDIADAMMLGLFSGPRPGTASRWSPPRTRRRRALPRRPAAQPLPARDRADRALHGRSSTWTAATTTACASSSRRRCTSPRTSRCRRRARAALRRDRRRSAARSMRRCEVEGRAIRTRAAADDVVLVRLRGALRGTARAADYIEIARDYHTVFVSGVPVFDASRDDAARRFVALVDEFYDRNVKLVLSALGRARRAVSRRAPRLRVRANSQPPRRDADSRLPRQASPRLTGRARRSARPATAPAVLRCGTRRHVAARREAPMAGL